MRKIKFKTIPENFPKKPKEGDVFLYGEKMIEQKVTKNEGQTVSYFKIVSIKGNNIEYITEFDKLTK